MDLSTNSNSNDINEGSQEYPYPSHVNVDGNVKLSGIDNYLEWKEQMLSLMDDHNMLGFVDGAIRIPDSEDQYREWKRSDDLVKGWILCTLSEDTMGTVVGSQTANQVWSILKANHTNKKKDFGEYLQLCRAIQLGDWEKAQEHFIIDKEALTCELTDYRFRALHIAIGNPKNIEFFEKLLEQINPESLPALVNDEQASALHYAAILDNTIAAKKLVEKNPDLLFTVENRKYLPVFLAVINSHEKTFRYLLRMSKEHIELSRKEGCYNPFEGEKGVLLLGDTIFAGFLDVAYDLLREYPALAVTNLDTVKGPLYCLAKSWNVYPSAKRYNFYQKFVYSHVPTENGLHHANEIDDIENQETYGTNPVTKCTKSYVYPVIKRIIVQLWKVLLKVPHIKHLHEDKVKHTLALTVLKFTCEEISKLRSDHHLHYSEAFLVAVDNNTPEVIRQITTTFPQSIWVDDKGYSFAQLAIMDRCENIYNFLVHEVTHYKHSHNIVEDDDKNNLLHLAAQLAPTHKLNLVTGAALQMQRELQWFKEVEKLMRPRRREEPNKKGETPIMVFRNEHKDLRQKGEEWMKKTAESYTITAALIITIVFAAAITIPGGNDGDTGKPVYINKPSFVIFAISDAISLFTSTTSLLLFLSVLTARFADEDFLYRLPKRLILGLVMLFISVTAMMIAFSATLYIMFGLENSLVLIPIASLACLPIASFVTLQLPLLVDLITSTYGPGIFVKGTELRITS